MASAQMPMKLPLLTPARLMPILAEDVVSCCRAPLSLSNAARLMSVSGAKFVVDPWLRHGEF